MEFLVNFTGTWQFAACFVAVQIAILVFVAKLLAMNWKHSPSQIHWIWKMTLVALFLVLPIRLVSSGWLFEIEKDPRALVIETPIIGMPPTEEAQSTFVAMDPALSSDTKSTAVEIVTGRNLLRSIDDSELAGTESIFTFLVFRNALLFTYLAVLIVFGFQILQTYLQLSQFCKSPALSGRFLNLVEEIRRNVNIDQPPKIVVNDNVESPLAFGLLKSYIVLPQRFLDWDRETQEIVLAHEFCHLKRRDVFWDMFAVMVRTIYWFHPAVGYARKQLIVNRELATDRAVLRLGYDAKIYAGTLLQVASGIGQVKKNRLDFLTPMAGEAELGYRIKEVLATNHSQLNRPIISKTGAIVSAVLLVVIASFSFRVAWAGPSGGLDLNTSPSVAESSANIEAPSGSDENETPIADNFYDVFRQIDVNPDYGKMVDSRTVNVVGHVSNIDGSPSSDAIVVIRDSSSRYSFDGRTLNGILAKTVTNKRGEYAFENIRIEGEYVFPEILAAGKTGGFVWESLNPLGALPVENRVDLKLGPTEEITGKLIGVDGNPVTGVKVSLFAFRKRQPDQLRHFTCWQSIIAPTTFSKKDGTFQFSALPKNVANSIWFEHEEFASYSCYICNDDEIVKDIKTWGHFSDDVFDGSSEITLSRGKVVSGKVYDWGGNAIRDALVQFMNLKPVKINPVTGEYRILIHERNLEYLENEGTSARFAVLRRQEVVVDTQIALNEFSDGQLDLKVPKISEISGLVLSEQGKPIGGAQVNFSSTDRPVAYAAITNRKGEFVKQLLPGNFTMQLSGKLPGYQMAGKALRKKKFKLEPGEKKRMDPITVNLISAVKAKVVDPQGLPLSGAEVKLIKLDKYSRADVIAETIKTSTDGFASLVPDSNLDGAILEARIEKDGIIYCGSASVKFNEQPTTIKLFPAVSASGQVTLNGKPLEGVILEFLISIPTHEWIEEGIAVSNRLGEVRTGNDGRFSFLVPAKDCEGRRAAIMAAIKAGIPNEQASWSIPSFKFDGIAYKNDYAFIQEDGKISGQVIDEMGQPVAGIGVYVARTFEGDVESFDLPSRLYQPALVYSGGDGKFEIQGLPKKMKYLIRTRDVIENSGRRFKVKFAEQRAKSGTKDLKLVVREK